MKAPGLARAAMTKKNNPLNEQLFNAVESRDFILAQNLCAQGARADAFFGPNHDNALFVAAILAPKWVKLLLPHGDPDLRDPWGYTALMMAAKHANLGAMKALLAKADPWLEDDDGDRALTWAFVNSQGPSNRRKRLSFLRLFAQIDPQLLEAEIAQSPEPVALEIQEFLAQLESQAIAAHASLASGAKPSPRL